MHYPPPPDPYHGEPDEWLDFSNPTGLEVMWRKVQALLGADGTVAGVVRGSKPDQWTAYATGQRSFRLAGTGNTPVEAMRDLMDKLGGVRGLEDLLRR
jgi:hypothetical protein